MACRGAPPAFLMVVVVRAAAAVRTGARCIRANQPGGARRVQDDPPPPGNIATARHTTVSGHCQLQNVMFSHITVWSAKGFTSEQRAVHVVSRAAVGGGEGPVGCWAQCAVVAPDLPSVGFLSLTCVQTRDGGVYVRTVSCPAGAGAAARRQAEGYWRVG